MLLKDSKGYYILENMDAQERYLFINFLKHEKERHFNDIVKIDKDIKYIDSLEDPTSFASEYEAIK